ncbi:PH domain-containing protein [Haloarculaceae archaeon H-GB11]|nr:PH domain-containing protein [Haloarculaceae archaeon H-GB11]
MRGGGTWSATDWSSPSSQRSHSPSTRIWCRTRGGLRSGCWCSLLAARATWQNRGRALGEDHVFTRNGFWRRRTQLVPYYRVQTVIEKRSFFQRRWDLSTVVVDTAGSRSLLGDDASAVDVDADDAREFARE